MEQFFAGEYIIYPHHKDNVTTYYGLKYTGFINNDREHWAKKDGELYFRDNNFVDIVWHYPVNSSYKMTSSAGLRKVPVTTIKLHSIQNDIFFYVCDNDPENIVSFSEKLEDGTEVLQVEPSKVFTKDEKEGILFRRV
jgi:hypothetical protein